MTKLTSKDIDWKDGMTFALVDRESSAVAAQIDFDPSLSGYGWAFHYAVERTKDEKRANLIDIINTFKAEFPDGYRSLLGYSKAAFKQEVTELSESAWLNDGEPQSYKAHKQWWSDVYSEACKMDQVVNRLHEKIAELKSEQNNSGWKNGDSCVCSYFSGKKCIFIGLDLTQEMAVIEMYWGSSVSLDYVRIDSLSKPETQEQKEPVKVESNNALDKAGWALHNELTKHGESSGHKFSKLKSCLKVAIETYLTASK